VAPAGVKPEETAPHQPEIGATARDVVNLHPLIAHDRCPMITADRDPGRPSSKDCSPSSAHIRAECSPPLKTLRMRHITPMRPVVSAIARSDRTALSALRA
jgi:hypothetical protein